MFGIKKLKNEVEKMRNHLIGMEFGGSTYNQPADYSLSGQFKKMWENNINLEIRVDQQRKLIMMLMDELGLELQEGQRIVKKPKVK